VPAAAPELTENATVLVVFVTAGVKAAVPPAGSPETVRLTLPLKLFFPVTAMVSLPVLARATLSPGVEVEREKVG